MTAYGSTRTLAPRRFVLAWMASLAHAAGERPTLEAYLAQLIGDLAFRSEFANVGELTN